MNLFFFLWLQIPLLLKIFATVCIGVVIQRFHRVMRCVMQSEVENWCRTEIESLMWRNWTWYQKIENLCIEIWIWCRRLLVEATWSIYKLKQSRESAEWSRWNRVKKIGVWRIWRFLLSVTVVMVCIYRVWNAPPSQFPFPILLEYWSLSEFIEIVKKRLEVEG